MIQEVPRYVRPEEADLWHDWLHKTRRTMAQLAADYMHGHPPPQKGSPDHQEYVDTLCWNWMCDHFPSFDTVPLMDEYPDQIAGAVACSKIVSEWTEHFGSERIGKDRHRLLPWFYR